MNLFSEPDLSSGLMLAPRVGPLRHFVRWSPDERLAFLPDGPRCVGLGITVGRERCPVCRGVIVHPDGTAQEMESPCHRSALTPRWCCLRETKERRR